MVTEFPEALRQQTNLTKINCGYHMWAECNITSLPEWIGELVNLEHINLDTSSVSQLPDSMQNLKKLQVLDLARTRIYLWLQNQHHLMRQLYPHNHPYLF